jgi:hypothetical protein
MSDYLIKKPLLFSHSELMAEVNAQQASLNWQTTYANYGHNTRFADITLSLDMIKKIENTCGFNIFKGAMYIWDYGIRKDVPTHKETPYDTQNKALSCIIPLVGRAVHIMWPDVIRTKCLEVCENGPGDLVILNSRRYAHESFVLDETRLSLHFFPDFELGNDTVLLEDLINMHPLVD